MPLRRPFGSTAVPLAAPAANMLLTHLPARLVGRLMDDAATNMLTLKANVNVLLSA